MDKLIYLKNSYNDLLKRNEKAEDFFEKNTIDECIKYLDLFNEVTVKLSKIIIEIEKITNKCMTKEEILNGFK